MTTASGPWESSTSSTWTHTYDPLGNLRGLSSSTSYTRTWSYGDATRPRVLTAFAESGGISDTEIAHDGAGNLTSRRRNGGTIPQTFVWNAQNRLYTINGYNLIESFTLSYDAFGRRVHQQITGGSTPTQIVYVGADFEYDTTLQQANLFFFAGGQRIASFASFGNYYADGGWTAWDDFGRRAGPPLGGVVLLVGLAGVAVLVTRRRPAWLAGTGAGFLGLGILLLPIPARTGGGGGGSVHGSHGETAGVYYLPDHLGSTRAVLNQYGDLLETRDYDPWGVGISHTGSFHLKHRFTSQPIAEVDASVGYGLQNYGARFYDPKWGRFVSSDEVTERFASQGVNSFGYVRSQPTSRVDPTGHMSIVDFLDQSYFYGRWSSDLGTEIRAAREAKIRDVREAQRWDANVRHQLRVENERMMQAIRAKAIQLDQASVSPPPASGQSHPAVSAGVMFGASAVAGRGADVAVFIGGEVSGEGPDIGAVVTFSGLVDIYGAERDYDVSFIAISAEIEDFATLTVIDINIPRTTVGIKLFIDEQARFRGAGFGWGFGWGGSVTRSSSGYYRTYQSGRGVTPRSP